jgi:hypothetical protein
VRYVALGSSMAAGPGIRPRANGAPPQVEALDGSDVLVTVTIGGNDVGYVREVAESLREVGGPVDDALRCPVARASRAAAPQRGRHARGRRSGDGTGRRRIVIVTNRRDP